MSNKYIDYLIISSTIDFSTDLVCYQMKKDNKSYYRLNRDEFIKHEITVDLEKKEMRMTYGYDTYIASFDHLKGIFFRAPVFLRTQSKKALSLEEQLERNQWSAFLRNLIVFENAIWINHPVATYRAENKMYQLTKAEESGLHIPRTLVSNDNNIDLLKDRKYVVKSLDTALFYDFETNHEMFTYSTVLTGAEIMQASLQQAPVFIQEYLDPKIDCRVTYVDGKMFPMKILKKGKGISGDWRLLKNELEYIPFELPAAVEQSLKNLMTILKLRYGGIDLAYYKDEYYFIEVNPTGEWGWLEVNSGIEISREIEQALCRRK